MQQQFFTGNSTLTVIRRTTVVASQQLKPTPPKKKKPISQPFPWRKFFYCYAPSVGVIYVLWRLLLGFHEWGWIGPCIPTAAFWVDMLQPDEQTGSAPKTESPFEQFLERHEIWLKKAAIWALLPVICVVVWHLMWACIASIEPYIDGGSPYHTIRIQEFFSLVFLGLYLVGLVPLIYGFYVWSSRLGKTPDLTKDMPRSGQRAGFSPLASSGLSDTDEVTDKYRY